MKTRNWFENSYILWEHKLFCKLFHGSSIYPRRQLAKKWRCTRVYSDAQLSRNYEIMRPTPLEILKFDWLSRSRITITAYLEIPSSPYKPYSVPRISFVNKFDHDVSTIINLRMTNALIYGGIFSVTIFSRYSIEIIL